jgi:hypothetical protein
MHIRAQSTASQSGVRIPYKTALAMYKHILSRPVPPYTCATIPATVDLAKVMVANWPETEGGKDLTVRASVHVLVDAWLDTFLNLEDVNSQRV